MGEDKKDIHCEVWIICYLSVEKKNESIHVWSMYIYKESRKMNEKQIAMGSWETKLGK